MWGVFLGAEESPESFLEEEEEEKEGGSGERDKEAAFNLDLER